MHHFIRLFFILSCATALFASDNLKPVDVAHFVDAYPKVQSWMAQQKKEGKLVYKLTRGGEDLYSGMLAASGLQGEFNTLIAPHGFAGSHDYFVTEERVKQAYLLLREPRKPRSYLKALQEQKQKTEGSDLPDASKKARLQQLAQQIGWYEEMLKQAERDIPALKPHMGRLDGMFKKKEEHAKQTAH